MTWEQNIGMLGSLMSRFQYRVRGRLMVSYYTYPTWKMKKVLAAKLCFWYIFSWKEMTSYVFTSKATSFFLLLCQSKFHPQSVFFSTDLFFYKIQMKMIQKVSSFYPLKIPHLLISSCKMIHWIFLSSLGSHL